MLMWLQQNYPTILVALALAGVVGLIIASMVRKRRRGASVGCGCGCGCAGCPSAGACHGSRK